MSLIGIAVEVAQKLYLEYKARQLSPAALVESICHDHNILIDYYPAENSRFSGMLWCDNERFTIVINSMLPNTRRLFTLAHELGHFMLHRYQHANFLCSVVYNQVHDTKERQANAFAAEILMPEEQMLSLIQRYDTKSISRILGVSEESAYYRVKNLEKRFSYIETNL